MTGLVRYVCEQGVATLTLNDPERRNALLPDMIDAIVAAVDRYQADDEARCAVLTGSGSAFSAGGDPRRMLAPGLYQDMAPMQIRRHYKEGVQRIPAAFYRLDKPVVAAINGAAVGAGCDLACLCDVRLASISAIFAVSFVKLGLVPGDGGAWLLPRIIGIGNASEMMLVGDAIDAETALGYGLVSRLHEPNALLEAAIAKARRIAANPPHAVQLTKRLLRECQDVSLDTAQELSVAMQVMAHRTEDHREAVTAFIDNRPANFRGL